MSTRKAPKLLRKAYRAASLLGHAPKEWAENVVGPKTELDHFQHQY